jgi:hypothetical protein
MVEARCRATGLPLLEMRHEVAASIGAAAEAATAAELSISRIAARSAQAQRPLLLTASKSDEPGRACSYSPC